MADRISTERLREIVEGRGEECGAPRILARELLALRTAPEGMRSAENIAEELATELVSRVERGDFLPRSFGSAIRQSFEARDAAHNVIAQRLRDRIAEAAKALSRVVVCADDCKCSIREALAALEKP